MKKIIFVLILMSLSFVGYADDSDATDSPDNGVAYNNLTNNFVHKHKESTANSAPNSWQAIVGIVGALGPKYPGSDTMIGQGAFMASFSYKNRIFLNNGQGLGVNIINTKPWLIGTSVNYSSANNFRGNEYPGLNNPESTFVGSVFANYTVSLYNLGIAAYKTVGHLEGAGYYQATITRAVPLSQQLIINLAVVAQYDDARYMQSLYGVTANEATASGLPSYTTHNGWDNISYGLTPMYSINKHWLLTGTIAGIRYLDQVANSPLLKQSENYAVAIGVIYNFF
jgi:outer membrane scaffolding protein for murein synthesis (MipA/OmpV family)